MHNYTDTGFKKIRAPEQAMKLLYGHWERNKEKKVKEEWALGNIYVNHWETPTYMVSVEDNQLEGVEEHLTLKNRIWDAVKPTIEEWTGMELKQISQYGIRIYTEAAVLSPHVDRLPLVSSCIINVAQDVDEPWPLEVIDRQGMAVNVTMNPGDMVLYESGSLIHARPFPLKGKYMANIFIHFEPTGRPKGDTSNKFLDELDGFLPPYLLPNSPWAKDWAQKNPTGWTKPSPSAAHVDTPEIHYAALNGDIDKIADLYNEDNNVVNAIDRNGWTPIHEAARAGQIDVVKLLLDYGVDKNVRTHQGIGVSPLAVAVNSLGEEHEVSRYLKSIGAMKLFPKPEEL
jgi:hypothetical protein